MYQVVFNGVLVFCHHLHLHPVAFLNQSLSSSLIIRLTPLVYGYLSNNSNNAKFEEVAEANRPGSNP